MPTTTFITFPFLALISIPLTITAAITIVFSILALFLQVWIVTFELCYALLTNAFIIPPSTNWSLLNFTVSGPNTPVRRRSSDYGFYHSPFAFRGQNYPALDPRRGSGNLASQESPDNNPFYTFDNRYTHRPNLRRNLPYTHSPGFFGLISGDEDRDFEGLGGWRCPPSSSKSPGYRSGTTTPSSPNSVSDEIDDIAWVSMNSRLELPSQPLLLRHGSNNNESPVEPYLPWMKNSRMTLSGAAADPRRGSKSQRHHRRSATTSMVSGFGVRSPTSQVLSRHDPRHHEQAVGQSKGVGVRSQSHTMLSTHWDRHSGPTTGGYLSLQSKSTGNGAETTSNTTPNEERKPASAAAGIAQYFASLGNR